MASMKGFRQLFSKNTKPAASPMPQEPASKPQAETRKQYNDRLFAATAANLQKNIRLDEARKG